MLSESLLGFALLLNLSKVNSTEANLLNNLPSKQPPPLRVIEPQYMIGICGFVLNDNNSEIVNDGVTLVGVVNCNELDFPINIYYDSVFNNFSITIFNSNDNLRFQTILEIERYLTNFIPQINDLSSQEYYDNSGLIVNLRTSNLTLLSVLLNYGYTEDNNILSQIDEYNYNLTKRIPSSIISEE